MWYGQKTKKEKHPQSKWTILKPLHMTGTEQLMGGRRWEPGFSSLECEVGNKQGKEARMIHVVLD